MTKKQQNGKISEEQYLREMRPLDEELVALQRWVVKKGLKICIVFEGRDGAGKGGVIKAITGRVNPRIFRVVALPKPSDREKSQMYVQRYVTQLPAAGEVVIFDRSWYNRAGVERVMGFCTEEECKHFLKTTPLFEKALIENGIILLKYWLDVDMQEQERRLKKRVTDKRKTWKLSPMDMESYRLWYDYSRARDEMLLATDMTWAPWFVADANDKKKVRLNIIRHLLKQIPYKHLPAEKVKFPPRQKPNGYAEPKRDYRCVEDFYGKKLLKKQKEKPSAPKETASTAQSIDNPEAQANKAST